MSTELKMENFAKVCDAGKNPLMLSKEYDNQCARELSAIWVNELGEYKSINTQRKEKLIASFGTALDIYKEINLEQKKEIEITPKDIDDTVEIMNLVSERIRATHMNDKKLQLDYYKIAKKELGINFIQTDADMTRVAMLRNFSRS